MATTLDRSTILIPVDVADPATAPATLVGESEPSLRRRILGTVTRSVNERTSSPTLVVRSE